MITQIAGLSTLLFDVAIFLLALYLVRSARVADPNGNHPVYAVRKYYAAGLFVVLAGLLSFTLPKTPYRAFANATPAGVVKVTGRMWSWQLEAAGGGGPPVLQAGQLVEFAVTAADVNHGFGIYDDAGNLLGQTQAMPGYVNRLRMVFPEPGTYHVLCMEYCGVIHHTMVSSFEVR